MAQTQADGYQGVTPPGSSSSPQSMRRPGYSGYVPPQAAATAVMPQVPAQAVGAQRPRLVGKAVPPEQAKATILEVRDLLKQRGLPPDAADQLEAGSAALEAAVQASEQGRSPEEIQAAIERAKADLDQASDRLVEAERGGQDVQEQPEVVEPEPELQAANQTVVVEREVAQPAQEVTQTDNVKTRNERSYSSANYYGGKFDHQEVETDSKKDVQEPQQAQATGPDGQPRTEQVVTTVAPDGSVPAAAVAGDGKVVSVKATDGSVAASQQQLTSTQVAAPGKATTAQQGQLTVVAGQPVAAAAPGWGPASKRSVVAPAQAATTTVPTNAMGRPYGSGGQYDPSLAATPSRRAQMRGTSYAQTARGMVDQQRQAAYA